MADMLLDDEGDITEAFVQVLTDVFNRFDVDKDESLSELEIDQYAKFLNGEPFSSDEKQQIKDVFDVTEKGSLTLKGFIEMYHMQTSSSPEETWQDLKKLGYDDKLKKKDT